MERSPFQSFQAPDRAGLFRPHECKIDGRRVPDKEGYGGVFKAPDFGSKLFLAGSCWFKWEYIKRTN